MSFETIKIVRALPIINGYVQIYSGLNSDKTKYLSSYAEATIVGSKEVNIGKQKILQLPEVRADLGYTTGNPLDNL